MKCVDQMIGHEGGRHNDSKFKYETVDGLVDQIKGRVRFPSPVIKIDKNVSFYSVSFKKFFMPCLALV